MSSALGRIARNGMAAAAVLGGLVLVGAVGNLFGSMLPAPTAPAPTAPAPETPERLPDYIADSRAGSERVSEIARRTRGDFTRATELEQRWLNGMTAGYGHELLRSRARLLGIKPEGPPPRKRGAAPA